LQAKVLAGHARRILAHAAIGIWENLRELAAHHAATVHLSINSLDSDLARKLEPRAASPN
jgi:hypothetical protein